MRVLLLIYCWMCGCCFVRAASLQNGATTQMTLLTTTPTGTTPREANQSDEQDYDQEDLSDDEDNSLAIQDEGRAVKNDLWAGYYDFLINEGSFKFWAAFQLATAVLLIYSSIAAVWYAKFNPLTSEYDYYDDFFFKRRSLDTSSASSSSSSSASVGTWLASTARGWFGGLDARTFQRILDAIASEKYS